MDFRPAIPWSPFLAALALLLSAAPSLLAQNSPHLAYAFPAGGQQGTTVRITVGGQFLQNVTQAFVSGVGVRAVIGEYVRPMAPMQATALRERMQELQKQAAAPAVQKEMADIRIKLLAFQASRLTSPVLAEVLTLDISIAPDAALGRHELRVSTPQGLSNPIAFVVGNLPEVSETESVTPVYPPTANPANALAVGLARPPTEMAVTLPVMVNGRIRPNLPKLSQQVRAQPFTPGEADRYHFRAREGQHLVVSASARELTPYLADAVPGWFQAVLALYDSAGKEVAYCDDYRFHPDPVLLYTVPKDGEYTVEIKDALYRGREDFVYRIAIGELPFVTSIFPLGGRAGTKTSVSLTGWNCGAGLQAGSGSKRIELASEKPGIVPLAVCGGQQPANMLLFQWDALPAAVEKEPNNAPAAAQRLKLPVIVDGRIDKPGDWDVFRFDGRKGQSVVAEVYGRRLQSPLDSVLRLTDAAGKQIAFNDDFEDKSAGLETHHADSFLMAVLPANSVYYLYIGDAQQKGGPEYAYRLRISAPLPDFEVRVAPSALNAFAGTTVPIDLHAIRRDGFNGDITISLKDAARGFSLAGGVIPAGREEALATLTVPLQPVGEPIRVSLEARATVNGREIPKAVIPTEDMMQAFAYRHLVPEPDLQVLIRRGMSLRNPIRISGEQPLRIPSGGSAHIRAQVPIPPNNQLGPLKYELSEPPEGITLRAAVGPSNTADLTIECDPSKAKPGLRGNLIVAISAERIPPPNAKAPTAAARQRVSLGSLPALPFEIMAK